MVNNQNQQEKAHISFNQQVRNSDEKRNYTLEKARIERILQQPAALETAVASINKSFEELANNPKTQLQTLALVEMLLEYVELNKAQTENVNKLIEDTSRTVAKLSIELDRQNRNKLTQHNLEKTLLETYSDYANISADITWKHLNKNFQELETQLDTAVTSAFNKIENRINLLLLLQVLCMIIAIIF